MLRGIWNASLVIRYVRWGSRIRTSAKGRITYIPWCFAANFLLFAWERTFAAFRPRDFYGFDRVEISHFLPFLAKMQVECFNFFMLSPAKMGLFFPWVRSFLSNQNSNISSWRYDDCLISVVSSIKKLFCFIILGKIGFSLWLPVANARGELQIYRPANVMEWYAVGPQPAYKTFEDILIVLLGSIEVNKWVCLCTYFAISNK